MTSHPVPPTRDTAVEAGTRAGSFPLERLRKRSDFLRAALGRRGVAPGFILHFRARPDRPGPIRAVFPFF